MRVQSCAHPMLTLSVRTTINDQQTCVVNLSAGETMNGWPPLGCSCVRKPQTRRVVDIGEVEWTPMMIMRDCEISKAFCACIMRFIGGPLLFTALPWYIDKCVAHNAIVHKFFSFIIDLMKYRIVLYMEACISLWKTAREINLLWFGMWYRKMKFVKVWE